jgi:alkylation response protein AidB-like acyl-CoA dehydrogenase
MKPRHNRSFGGLEAKALERESGYGVLGTAMLHSSVVRGTDVIFAFSAEQEELRKSVRKFLEDKSPETEVRRLMESVGGYDPAVWTQLCGQLGLAGLAIPEQYGGSGYGYVELIVVFEEMGRALLCAPYFSTVALAANLLLTVDDESAKVDYLPGLASGEKIGTVALAETTGRWDETGVTTAATQSASGWLLNGEKSFVTDGHVADVVFVAARTHAGVSIFAVDKGATGFVASALATLDQTRKQAKLTFAQTPARLIGDEGAGWPALSKMLDLAAVALAAEQVGGAQQILDVTVQYAKDREQFGQPIGSFQVIKHKCADMLLEVESARSAAYYAGWAAADDGDDLPIAASLAKSYCSEAYFHAAAESIQIHGGIGFTWEHPVHLYFKRAKSSELLFGDGSYHRELLAQRVGI